MIRKEVRKINKKLILPALAIGILVLGVIDAQTALAQNSKSPMNSLVEKIATKFNLNKDEVQKVFDEVHEERQAEMQVKAEERLSLLVTEGKITEAQKTLILSKHKEMQAEREKERETWQNLSQDERKTQMETKRKELQTWAEEKGINVEYLFGGGFMKGGGPHGPMQ